MRDNTNSHYVRSILVLMLALVIMGCKKPAEQDEKSPSITVDVKVAAITSGSLDETVMASGSTTNQRESQLRSPINGVITKFQFFNGDTVRKGETVATIQTRESQASIQGAEKLLRSAATPSQRDEAEKALALTRESANTALVTAPFTGILNNKLKNEMELAAEDEPIASLIDPRSLVFIADVPSQSLASIKKDQHAVIRFPMHPGKVFQGTVNRIEPLLNPTEQTAHVQITFSEPNVNLQRSLFGDATFIIGRKSGILLAPVAALLRNDENNTTSVMVVGKDSISHKIDIRVGIRQDSVVQVIAKELSEGDRVIVQGHYGLPDSTRVRIIQ
ncbi:MAG: efflux RND transporter periplasmic adaptor subunit [Bacteroidota bacterium]